MQVPTAAVSILVFAACASGLALGLYALTRLVNPIRRKPVKDMPYESGMDPIHDARRRFDVRFYLVAVAFVVFDVELLFLYPWAVAASPALQSPGSAPSTAPAAAPAAGIDAAVASGAVGSRHMVFAGAMVFIALLAVGWIYDWRKGIFRWR